MGLDMSYTSAGVALYNDKDKKIVFHVIKHKAGTKFNENVVNAITISNRLTNFLKDEGTPNAVFIEQPFNGANFSSGLYLLDGVVINNLYTMGVSRVYTFHTSYLNYIKMIKKADKKTSLELAKKIVEVFEKHGYDINKEKYTHDESEALIFLTRGVCMFSKDKKLCNDLILCAIRFKEEKESLVNFNGENT